jgi:hypothetical protein
MKTVIRFLVLVVALNVARYVGGFPFERYLIYERLFGAMEQSASYFNTSFTTLDWVTSFFYNFMMWLTATWGFVLIEPRLTGSMMLKSLKVFGLMYLFFASVSAIYMNHYSHPKGFYIWNILDGGIAFGVVAVVNGFLYPRLFKSAHKS